MNCEAGCVIIEGHQTHAGFFTGVFFTGVGFTAVGLVVAGVVATGFIVAGFTATDVEDVIFVVADFVAGDSGLTRSNQTRNKSIIQRWAYQRARSTVSAGSRTMLLRSGVSGSLDGGAVCSLESDEILHVCSRKVVRHTQSADGGHRKV